MEHGVAEVGMREEQIDSSPKIVHIRNGFSLDEVVVSPQSVISDDQANYLRVLVQRLISTDAAVREQAAFDATQIMKKIDEAQNIPYAVLNSMLGQSESERPSPV